MTEWRARAPVRFCDLGGWTDTRIVPRGAVLNFTARLYTHVTLDVHEGPSGITLESLDTDERSSFHNIREVEYNGVLDLLKAAVARARIETKRSGVYSSRRKVTLRVRSGAPPASGLGSSAALGVAAMGALAAYNERHLLPHEIARESQLLETQDLGLECGVQDQLASAYGGVNFMEVEYPNARIFPLELPQDLACELEDRFVLVYTGKSHFSSGMHQKVISEADQHRADFDALAAAAIAGKEALLSGDLDAFGAAMDANWDAQKNLHPDITTPEIEALHRAALAAGAIGFKANGAGGGGTVTILARSNQSHRVARAAQELGMTVLPALIDTTGLQVWARDS
jgi:D-glycero-alpha-D-manno-heptose-7-phosphate kinase